jgi:hypothetical protein
MRSDHRPADGDRSHIERIDCLADVVGASAAAACSAAVGNLPSVDFGDQGRYSVHASAKFG